MAAAGLAVVALRGQTENPAHRHKQGLHFSVFHSFCIWFFGEFLGGGWLFFVGYLFVRFGFRFHESIVVVVVLF